MKTYNLFFLILLSTNPIFGMNVLDLPKDMLSIIIPKFIRSASTSDFKNACLSNSKLNEIIRYYFNKERILPLHWAIYKNRISTHTIQRTFVAKLKNSLAIVYNKDLNVVELFDLDKSICLAQFENSQDFNPMNAYTVSEDETLFTAKYTDIITWDINSGKKLLSISMPTIPPGKKLNDLNYSKDNKYLTLNFNRPSEPVYLTITYSEHCSIIYDINENKFSEIEHIPKDKHTLTIIPKIQRVDKFLVCTSTNNQLENSDKLLPNPIIINHDKQFVLGISKKEGLTVWNSVNGEIIYQFKLPITANATDKIAMSKDNKYIIIYSLYKDSTYFLKYPEII